MGQRRQVQKTHEAMRSLATVRLAMMAAPVGERVTSLAQVEFHAVRAYEEAHSYYRKPVSRRVLHAAALTANRLVET